MITDREITDLKKALSLLDARVVRLEAEEAREQKEGTIRKGTKRGRKPKN